MARPSLIDAPVGTTPDGQIETHSERIVNALTLGAFFEDACAYAGISTDTGRGWLRIAATLDRKTLANPDNPPSPTPHELACQRFSAAVRLADSQYHIGQLGLLTQAARGTLVKTVTTERLDAAGKLVGKTVRTESIPPDTTVIFKRLAQRFPDRYRGNAEVEDRDPVEDALSDAQRADSLVHDVEVYLAGAAAAKVKRKPRAKRDRRPVLGPPEPVA